MPICIFSALLHESGHILAALLLGVDISSVSVGVGGVNINCAPQELKRGRMGAILLAGSGVNFAVCIISLLVLGEIGNVFEVNFLMGVFNLLPARGLDGAELAGLILESAFIPEKAYKIQKALSWAVPFLIWIISMYVLIFSAGNFSLYLVFFALFITSVKAYG